MNGMLKYTDLYGARVRRNKSFLQNQLIQWAADSLAQVMQKNRFSLHPKTSFCKKSYNHIWRNDEEMPVYLNMLSN